MDFKNKTKISFRELKTDIILNKRTHILLHDLSLFKNDSFLLKDLNIKAGNLSLYMKNEKDINFIMINSASNAINQYVKLKFIVIW